MSKFTIELKNEKLRLYIIISWLIIALNFISFIYVGRTGSSKIPTLPYFSSALLLIIFLFRFISKRQTFENDRISLSFSVTIISWIVLQYYWAAGIILFLYLFQDISRRKLIVLFFDDRIVYPSFPKRTIMWEELNNVMIKDSWLTIDMKNNKVFQNEILSPASEIDFNEYCSAKLMSLKNNGEL